MKRILLFALTLALVLSLAACGGSGDNGGNNSGGNGGSQTEEPDKTREPEQTEKPAVTLTAQELLDSVKESMGESYTSGSAETEDRMNYYYGLDLSQVESWAADGSLSSLNMDLAVVLQVKEGYAETAAALLQERLDQTASYAQMYNMDLFRVNEARIYVNGNYVGYFIQGTPADWQEPDETQAKQAADEAAKIDAAWKAVFDSAENIAVIPEPKENSGGFFDMSEIPEDDDHVYTGEDDAPALGG